MMAAMAGFQPPQIPGLIPHPGLPTTSEQEKEVHAALLLQQQHQMQMAALQKQLLDSQTQAHHIVPSAHPPLGLHLPPHLSADPMQEAVFQFPSAEDVARAQQHQQQLVMSQMGLPEGMQVLPHGFHIPQGGAEVIRQHSEEAGHPGVPHLPGLYPPPFMTLPPGLHNMEAIQHQALLAQQQQQQQLPVMQENIVEFVQQAELLIQQVHKDPNLLRQPHVQVVIAQYQHLQEQYSAAAAIHHHHQQQQFAVLQQQEMLKQQQQLQQQHQAATTVSKFPSTMRPGVIMNMQSK